MLSRRHKQALGIMGLSAVLALNCAAETDGLRELEVALSYLDARSGVSATLSVDVVRHQGEDEEKTTRRGAAEVLLQDSDEGLFLHYSPVTLALMDEERWRRERDTEAETPTLNAIDELSPGAAHRALSAAPGLLRQIHSGEYQGETTGTFDGQAARRLHFTFGLERLSEREKKYVKKYTSDLYVWLNQDALPIASELRSRFSGSAFIIIRFASSTDEVYRYQVVGDRLLVSHSLQTSEISGAGERAAHSIEHRLTLMDHKTSGDEHE